MSEAAKLCSYMHFREPKLLPEKSLLQKANMDKSIDFMDNLEEDIPKGESQMSLTVSTGSGGIVLMSTQGVQDNILSIN